MMTVRELINKLQRLNPHSEVRLMTQPNHPFQHEIDGLAVSDDFDEWHDDEGIVFICEGTQLSYGSDQAWDVLR